MFRLVLLVLAFAVFTYGASIGSRIVGGQNATEGAYPYQVSLRNEDYHFCGGSVINERWILTAAHCVDTFEYFPSEIIVVVGTIKLYEGGDFHKGSRVLLHPMYDATLMLNDLALLEVSEPISFGPNVQPAVLPTEDFTKSDYPAVLTGWGILLFPGGETPNNLQWITLNIMPQLDCLLSSSMVTSSNICTLTVIGEGACHGDSGGSLIADGVQVGIVSWGIPCARGIPDIYTRVWNFVDWINENVN